MNASAHALVGRTRPRRWSVAAFLLAVIGLAASTWVILGSDGDSSQVRWWLVVAPLALTAVPVLLPDHRVRLGAAIALGGWCVLASASIGVLLLPALVLSIVAIREGG